MVQYLYIDYGLAGPWFKIFFSKVLVKLLYRLAQSREDNSNTTICTILSTYILYTVKKGFRFSRPQPGCHKPNSPCPGII
jgi:hypothetical protein